MEFTGDARVFFEGYELFAHPALEVRRRALGRDQDLDGKDGFVSKVLGLSMYAPSIDEPEAEDGRAESFLAFRLGSHEEERARLEGKAGSRVNKVGILGKIGGLGGTTLGPEDLERLRQALDVPPALAILLAAAPHEEAVRGLAGKVPGMREAGMDSEAIARSLHAERRALGVQFKDLTPAAKLEEIAARNLERYGDKLGPTIDWLRASNKTWEQIIESATRPGGKDLGF